MTKLSAENQERARILRDMGWSNAKIGREFGVTEFTIRRWLSLPDKPEIKDQMEALRTEKRQQYISQGWDIVYKLNEVVKDRIEAGEVGSVKDCAIVQGIYMDKIGTLEARRSSGSQVSPVNIMILPPSDGHTTRVIQDPIRVSGESEPILSDDSGSRSGEDLLRLPQGDSGGVEQSGEFGDDSSLDLPEPA